MGERLLSRAHPTVRHRTHRAVKNYAVRDEPAHRRIGRRRNSVWLPSRHGRDHMHRLIGQRGHRDLDKVVVGLFLRRRGDENDWPVNRGQPIGVRVRTGVKHAGSDHLHRIAPIGLWVLKWLTAGDE
jgi:hypothetical protein